MFLKVNAGYFPKQDCPMVQEWNFWQYFRWQRGQQTLARNMMDGDIVMNVYMGNECLHKHTYKSLGKE